MIFAVSMSITIYTITPQEVNVIFSKRGTCFLHAQQRLESVIWGWWVGGGVENVEHHNASSVWVYMGQLHVDCHVYV